MKWMKKKNIYKFVEIVSESKITHCRTPQDHHYLKTKAPVKNGRQIGSYFFWILNSTQKFRYSITFYVHNADAGGHQILGNIRGNCVW